MKFSSSPLAMLACLALLVASAPSVYGASGDVKQHAHAHAVKKSSNLQSQKSPTPSAPRFLQALEPQLRELTANHTHVHKNHTHVHKNHAAYAKQANQTQATGTVTHVPKHSSKARALGDAKQMPLHDHKVDQHGPKHPSKKSSTRALRQETPTPAPTVAGAKAKAVPASKTSSKMAAHSKTDKHAPSSNQAKQQRNLGHSQVKQNQGVAAYGKHGPTPAPTKHAEPKKAGKRD